MELNELIPEKPTFTLSSTKKEYELRIPNLEDKIEMTRIAGGTHENFIKIFEEKKWDSICKIVYRLLIDKSDFLAQKEPWIDDEGFEKEVIVIGPIRLLRAITTQSEATALLSALVSAISAGEPLIKDYIKSELKKKGHLDPLTGERSSISSHQNTDIPLNKSDHLHSGSLM